MSSTGSTAGRPSGGLTGGLGGLVGTIAFIALLALLAIAIEPLRTATGDALQGDTASLRTQLRELGVGGVAIVLGLALVHSVLFYPAEILDAAAGFVYGFWLALLLVMVGWVMNAVISYLIGAHAARPLLYRAFGHDRFLRYEGLIARGGVTLLLAMRLVPIVPFSLFSYVAGSARVPMWTFTWTTAVGYLPLTAFFVYLGSRLESISLDDPVIWIGAIGLVALLLLGHRLLSRGDGGS